MGHLVTGPIGALCCNASTRNGRGSEKEMNSLSSSAPRLYIFYRLPAGSAQTNCIIIFLLYSYRQRRPRLPKETRKSAIRFSLPVSPRLPSEIESARFEMRVMTSRKEEEEEEEKKVKFFFFEIGRRGRWSQQPHGDR